MAFGRLFSLIKDVLWWRLYTPVIPDIHSWIIMGELVRVKELLLWHLMALRGTSCVMRIWQLMKHSSL